MELLADLPDGLYDPQPPLDEVEVFRTAPDRHAARASLCLVTVARSLRAMSESLCFSRSISVSLRRTLRSLSYTKNGMEMNMRRLVDAKQSKTVMQSIKMSDIHVYHDTVPVLAVRRPWIAVYHLPHHSSSV